MRIDLLSYSESAAVNVAVTLQIRRLSAIFKNTLHNIPALRSQVPALWELISNGVLSDIFWRLN